MRLAKVTEVNAAKKMKKRNEKLDLHDVGKKRYMGNTSGTALEHLLPMLTQKTYGKRLEAIAKHQSSAIVALRVISAAKGQLLVTRAPESCHCRLRL